MALTLWRLFGKCKYWSAQGAWAVKGNHDAMAVSPPAQVSSVGDSTAEWTHQQLNAEQLDFLDKLPLTIQQDNILMVHASANEPEFWRYVVDERSAGASLDAAAKWEDVRYVFGGHVHEQIAVLPWCWCKIDALSANSWRGRAHAQASLLVGHDWLSWAA